jgi:hypothetical protein
VGALCTVSQIQMLDSVQSGVKVPLQQAEVSDARQRTVMILELCLLWPALVVFMVWVYRANVNARALGAEWMEYSPGWSVIWFFVPIVGLYKPYFVMKELWKASSPGSETSQRLSKVSPLLAAWWLVGLVEGMTHYSRWSALTGEGLVTWALRFHYEIVAHFPDSSSLDFEMRYLWGLLFASLVGIAETVLAIAVVLSITNAQLKRKAETLEEANAP